MRFRQVASCQEYCQAFVQQDALSPGSASQLAPGIFQLRSPLQDAVASELQDAQVLKGHTIVGAKSSVILCAQCKAAKGLEKCRRRCVEEELQHFEAEFQRLGQQAVAPSVLRQQGAVLAEMGLQRLVRVKQP
eukprot:1202359-Amphidinium_carterae.1